MKVKKILTKDRWGIVDTMMQITVTFVKDKIFSSQLFHIIFIYLINQITDQDIGIKISICTSDDRIPTTDMINQTGISKYIDYYICGDDEGKSNINPFGSFSISQSSSGKEDILNKLILKTKHN